MGKHMWEAVDAVREEVLARIAIQGVTGSGKTLLALRLAERLVKRLGLGPVYVLDTEHGSALEYAYSQRTKSGFVFKHIRMPPNDNSPATVLDAMAFAEGKGAGAIVLDSMSHSWSGIGGVLEMVDEVTKASRSGNSFSEGWRKMSPAQLRYVEALMNSKAHFIATMRQKSDWVIEENDRGKREPKKIGLQAMQRQDTDYEFSLVATMTAPNNDLIIEKSRALDRPELAPGRRYEKPDDDFCDMVIDWLTDRDGPARAPVQQSDPLTNDDPHIRAKEWRRLIAEAPDAIALIALMERSKGDPNEELRKGVQATITKRRMVMALGTTAPAEPAPAQPAPTSSPAPGSQPRQPAAPEDPPPATVPSQRLPTPAVAPAQAAPAVATAKRSTARKAAPAAPAQPAPAGDDDGGFLAKDGPPPASPVPAGETDEERLRRIDRGEA